MPLRVIVADSHPLFCEALVSKLQRTLPGACVECAGSVQQLLKLIQSGQKIDLLTLDLYLPGLHSLEVFCSLRQALEISAIIIISMADNQALIQIMMTAGANGFIDKNTPSSELQAAIVGIREGLVVVKYKPSVRMRLSQSYSVPSNLTARQLQVWHLVAQGKTNKDIGRLLQISPFTARIHVSSLMRALKVPNRVAAVARYFSAGIG